MRFSCGLPVDDVGEEFLSIEAIGEMVRAVDAAGLDGCWVTDHPAPSRRWLDHGGHSTLDPFVALSVAATASPRIRLHTHVLILAYRNPLMTAKAAASLDVLSGGRLTLGVGVGYLRPEYAALGMPFEERGALTTEAIQIMQRAWTGEPVAHQGLHFNARDAVVLPRPVQQPGPLIWGGGNGAPAIRRAMELCDGWCPFPADGVLSNSARTDELSSLEQLRDKLAFARDYAHSIGRTRPFDICMTRFGNAGLKVGDSSSAARAVDDYAALAELGVNWSTIAFYVHSRSAYIEGVQWFGEEIASKLPDRA